MVKKAHDYSKSSDVLSNFRLTAILRNTTVEDIILDEITKKTIRLTELYNSKKKAKNESIEDTISDLRNYAFLLRCARLENKRKEKNKNKK